MRLAAALERLGTESAFEVLARATALARTGRSIINLGIGQPDFPTPPNIVEAAVRALREGHHGYTPANGILPLREAVAEDMLARRGVAVDPDRVVVVPGGKVTMAFAVLMFGEPGAEIMYPDPGFPIYRSLIEYTGAEPVPIALHEAKGFAFSAEEVLARITPRTRLIIVNSPANPTGGVVPQAEIDALARGLERFPDVAVLSDEIYARMCYDGVPHASLLPHESLRDRLILLDGWSKTYAMTGWRLGWGVWPEALAPHGDPARDQHPLLRRVRPPSGPASRPCAGRRTASTRMVAEFDRRRDVIVAELNRIPGFRCVRPGGAFYAFPNVEGTGKGSRQLQDELLDKLGVAVISGTSFGINGEGYLRFSYAASTEAILEACERIRRYLG